MLNYMQDKKQIIGLILSVVLSVGLVVVGVNAATTVGTDVSVAGDLAVVSTTTLNGDVVLGNAAGDNILITGVITNFTAATGTIVDANVSGDLDVGNGTTTLGGDLVVANNIAAADDLSVAGYATATAGLTIGAGQVISKHLSAAASLDFGVITAATCATASMAVTGAASADTVTVGVPYAFVITHDAISWSGYATTNVAVVKVCNPSGASTPDFAAGTFRVDVWKH